jgi:predicted nucleic acid-binding protein
MSVFIDTSAFLALLSSDDSHHGEATRIWAGLLETRTGLETHNYIVVETVSIIQSRFDFRAAEAFLLSLRGVVRVHWTDEGLHSRAESAFYKSGGEIRPEPRRLRQLRDHAPQGV